MPDMQRWSEMAKNWTGGRNLLRVETIDAHTAGEPLRIFVDGFPEPQGKTILEKRQDAQRRLETFRTGTMWEPRGHAEMYGCLLVSPERESSDFGVLFLHNEGYSTMCGHGIIAIAKVAVEVGWIAASSNPTPIRIDTPAGQVFAEVHLDEQAKVKFVSFDNVDSFVVDLDATLTIDGLGTIEYDLAFGGAFYAYVDADQLNISLSPENQFELVRLGRQIKQSLMKSRKIEHPDGDELSFLYGVIFTGQPSSAEIHSRHVCVFADGEVDRSPTGTGVSGRAAILAARKELSLNQRIRIESIIGSTFDVEIVRESNFGSFPSVTPRVFGNAFITGRHEFFFDPQDNLQHGFILR